MRRADPAYRMAWYEDAPRTYTSHASWISDLVRSRNVKISLRYIGASCSPLQYVCKGQNDADDNQREIDTQQFVYFNRYAL